MEQNTQLWLLPTADTHSMTLAPGEGKSFSFIECFDGKFSYEIWLRYNAPKDTKLGLYVNGKTIYEYMTVDASDETIWRLFGNFQVVKGEHQLEIRNNDDIPFYAEAAIVTRDSGYIRRGTADEHRIEIMKGRNIDDIFKESGMKFSEEEPEDVKKARIAMLYKQGFVERENQDAAENQCRNGVPLGGVGTGKIELDSDGVFTAITINNNFDVPLYKTEGSFFAIKCGNSAKILQKVNYNDFAFPTVESIEFEGLFPTAKLKYSDPEIPVNVSLSAYSFLPHDDVKNSVVPAAVFEFTVENPTEKSQNVSLLSSFENLLGTGGSMGLKSKDDNGRASFVMNTWNPGFTWSDRTGTYQEKISENSLSYKINTQSKNPQSVGDYTLLCLTDSCRVKRSWRIRNGGELWDEFLSGTFTDNGYVGAEDNAEGGYDYVAGAICADFELAAGETKTVTFIFAWNMPHFIDIHDKDIGVYYSNFFTSSQDVAKYVAEHKDEIYARTTEIQNVLKKSSLPDWLKTKLINDMFPIVTCSWFDKAGIFRSTKRRPA